MASKHASAESPGNVDRAKALREWGDELYHVRRIGAAQHAFEAAAAVSGDPTAFAERRWMCAMLRGEFERAWRIGDDILRRRRGLNAAHLPRHLRWIWDGRDFVDRDVLVSCNHGLGDTLQFIRFVPCLAERTRSVTVEAQPELLPLLASVPGISRLVPLGGATSSSEVAIEVMELPHALRVTLASLPSRVPYLTSTSPNGGAAPGAELTVGLVWRAGGWRPERSVPLRLLEPLAALPGIKLISLQQGEAVRDLERSPLGGQIAQPATGKANILRTVELIRQLDLVLTVDTMVAHLAGALGAAVWTMLDSHADWRWMVDRRDSPWYPTMRLFRQRRSGDWPPVIDEVVRALCCLHHTPALEQRRARGVACGRRRADMATTKVTTDHQVIREWAEERGGKPAVVRSTHRGKDPGILRLEFLGAPHADDETLEEISWGEWLAKFDDAELALLYEDKTAAGKKSNFNKLVKRETVQGGAHG
jgi:hypothetical protein